MDYVMHFLTIFWKVIFASIPPTEYCGGWAAFCVAIIYIGALTAIVGEFAMMFGCAIGLPTEVTAITFVALGKCVYKCLSVEVLSIKIHVTIHVTINHPKWS